MGDAISPGIKHSSDSLTTNVVATVPRASPADDPTMTNCTATPDRSSLPAPCDDGETNHLTHLRLPSIPLSATHRTTSVGTEAGGPQVAGV